MTSKRFIVTVIVIFIIILLSVPFTISCYQSRYHKLDYNVTSIVGEIKNDVAHIEINGTVRKRLIDLKKYDDENYIYGPCEGGEPQMHNIEVSSDSFKISNRKNNFIAYVDIDLIKEFGKDYNKEQAKIYSGGYVKQMWLCAADSNKNPYEYNQNHSDRAVLYMTDFEYLKVRWK